MHRMGRTVVAIIAVVTTGVWHGTLLVAGQDAGGPRARTLVAILSAVDADAETVSLKARASVAATRSAERVQTGEQVRFRWEGPERRRVHRIMAVTPLSASGGAPLEATGRGHFAMNGEFVSLNRRARTVTFSIPVDSTWVATLQAMRPGEWVAIRCEIDRQGQITAVTSVEPLSPRPAGG